MIDFSNALSGPLRRSWLLLSALLVTHLLFILLLNPTEIGHTKETEWLNMLGVGAMFAQPILFGSWASIGPPPAIKRVPLMCAAVSSLMLISGVKTWNLVGSGSQNSLDVEWVLMGFAFFAAGTFVMWLVRRLTGMQIVTAQASVTLVPKNQFTTKQLMAWITIVALLLGAGRGLASARVMSADWRDSFSRLSTSIGLVLLVIIPVVIAPLISLAPRPSVRMVLASIAAWLSITWISIKVVVVVENEPPDEVLHAVALLQAGGMLAAVFSAFVIRLAGYRLLSVSAAKKQTAPVIP